MGRSGWQGDATAGPLASPVSWEVAAPGRAPPPVNRRVDIVFREVFGREGHEDLLVDLLNEVLRPARPIRSVKLRSPFVFPESPSDRAVVVDLDATDDAGDVYHVEMQTTAESTLRKRMMFVWAAVFRHQLTQGDGFAKLAPVISVWICERSVVTDAEVGRGTARGTPAGRCASRSRAPGSRATLSCTS